MKVSGRFKSKITQELGGGTGLRENCCTSAELARELEGGDEFRFQIENLPS